MVDVYDRKVKKEYFHREVTLRPPFDFINPSYELKSKRLFTQTGSSKKCDVVYQISPMDLTVGGEICQTQTIVSFLESFSIENMKIWMILHVFEKLKSVGEKSGQKIGTHLNVFLPTQVVKFFQDGSQAFFIDEEEPLEKDEEIRNIYMIDVKRMKKSVYDHIAEFKTYYMNNCLLISEINPKNKRYTFINELSVRRLIVDDFFKKFVTNNPYVSKEGAFGKDCKFSKELLEYFELEANIVIATRTIHLHYYSALPPFFIRPFTTVV